MDILACPIDKHYPLELHVFEEKEEITEGLLVCPKCDRWYPISDEIPQMLPDDLRDSKEDLEWLNRWKQRVPTGVLAHGKPFRLEQEPWERGSGLTLSRALQRVNEISFA